MISTKATSDMVFELLRASQYTQATSGAGGGNTN
jgi:hypothetical protein